MTAPVTDAPGMLGAHSVSRFRDAFIGTGCLAARSTVQLQRDEHLHHDGHDQLTHEQSSRWAGYTNVFNYDPAGNPTTWKGATQTFNQDNQNNASTFDLDGNPASWQGNALTFDAENHLTAVGSVLTAGYNAEGLRVWKQSSAGTTYFLYDGITPIAEVDSSCNVHAVNTWGANGLASRRTVSTNSSTFYSFDVQGSTALRLDANGNTLGSYGFDAYGTRASTDNSSDPYSGFGAQFGYYRDAETGLSLLGHRYYDPGQGRFLNRDPIRYRGGLNLYSYVRNRPMIGIDPSGFENSFGHIADGGGGGGLDEAADAAEAEAFEGNGGGLGGGTGGGDPCPGIDGGDIPRIALSGDGYHIPPGMEGAPEEAEVTLGPQQYIHYYCDYGDKIANPLGLAVEDGTIPSSFEVGKYGPGETVPNSILAPSPRWQSLPTSYTPSEPETLLDILNKKGPGDYYWAACREVRGQMPNFTHTLEYGKIPWK